MLIILLPQTYYVTKLDSVTYTVQKAYQGAIVISKVLLLLAIVGCFVKGAYAHPVAYSGSNSLMTWNSKMMSDWMYTHTFAPTYSLSARYQRIQTSNGERTFYLPAINFLAKRWNELDSQANIYLSVGHGGEVVKHSFKDTSLLAVESDWESRKYYFSAREEALLVYKKRNNDIYMTRARAGFAPYLAEFNELNSWFILQFEKQSRGMDNFTVTPMIRLFYHNVLTEFGVSQKGDAQFNFMIHF
jgi:hypothetical protein